MIMTGFNQHQLVKVCRIYLLVCLFTYTCIEACFASASPKEKRSNQPPGDSAQNNTVPLKIIDDERVAEIMPMLSDEPAGFGDPSYKREVWDQLDASGAYDTFMKEMDAFVFPAFSEDDYFSLSNGTATSSASGLNMMRNRAKGLSQLTWAECLENKGRFVPLIETGLKELLRQKSWVSPRNDFDFKNYNGEEYSVELTSALYAHTIAQTLYLLGHKIDKSLYDEMIKELYKRAFHPVLDKIRTRNDHRENRFLVMTNNYNHVCLAGIVGAALAIIQNKYERAVFACIGEYYSRNGLAGFGDDGYCSEGVGYFNYGFGHFVQLRECLWQATKGKIDLFDHPNVSRIASFPSKLEIADGVYPSISDSRAGIVPEPDMMLYVNRNCRLGIGKYEHVELKGKTSDNRMSIMMVFPNSASAVAVRDREPDEEEQLRSFFEQSAVLVTRPTPGSASLLGIAIKGGHNNEHHNHNDVGAYTVVWGKEIIAGDPGAIPYTADIFNEKYRYTYKSIGSYGHPVPLVAGKEQRSGKDAKAVILNKKYTHKKDTFTIDIRSAYDVPALTKLERRMIYSRQDKGEWSVEDTYAFSRPEMFETAVITRSEWENISDTELVLKGKDACILVTFGSPDNRLTLSHEEIKEGDNPYTRIAISTTKPSKGGRIVVTYKPYVQ